MSTGLIARSPDLQRLRDEGYDIAVKSNYLLLYHVPYVTAERTVEYGTLVSALDQTPERTKAPETHVAYFIGEHPCRADGSVLSQITHASNRTELAEGITVDHAFSCKPSDGSYLDYYHKMTNYVRIISDQARRLDPDATAITNPIIEPEEDEYSVFNYPDTASTRANIVMAAKKLEPVKLAIVGLGGTGSYVLDFVAKTRACEIHLFDGDEFSLHNAFRSPGAPSRDEVGTEPKKVAYFAALYGKMRKNIIVHEAFVDGSNVGALQGMDFVFLCIDKGGAKKLIVEALEASGTPFVDVGMGVTLVDSALRGTLRATTSTSEHRQHFRRRVSLADTDEENEYDLNIQIAELNALNAALAVIKWKKLFGFYLDEEQEYHCTYSISHNTIINNDLA